MSDFQEYLNEQLKNPAFRAEWEALEPEYQIKRMLIEERTRKQLTQKQLAELTGITQADISRLENGTANPSIRTLQRLAAALGMMVKVEFVPLPVAKE